ncbi:MAG TPA: winged helix-turn-helix transcriptional regulator, partial [Candidatus Nanoarchaeia archaeon]|nr:winged helix-turn-helix transcriptional regulator [Candidatus Nanoarchaeia archaeon]
ESPYKRFTNIVAPIALETPVPPRGKNPIYELRDRSYAMAREIAPIILDDIDKRIIKHLLTDPRMRLRILAQKIGINPEVVRYRINSYVKRGFIINFGLLHDFKKYGLSTHYLLLKIKSLDIPSFKSYLENNKNVFYSAKLLGAYNCILYITSQDPDSFATQLKTIRRLIGKSLITMDLLHLETVHKYVQFPEGLLR